MAEMVEKMMKKTPELQALSPALRFTRPGDVECDFCTGTKHKAIKSCLMCMASFCETHLKPHYEVPGLKKHKLVKASSQLQEKICSQHDKLMDIYCRTDQSNICYMCSMDEHKGHDTVTVLAERSEKQNQLKELQLKFRQRLQEKQEKMEDVRQSMNTIKSSAQAALEHSEKIFTEMISSIEKKRSEVLELIRDREKVELSRAEELLKYLEQGTVDLMRRDDELEQLLHAEDHIHFLQNFQSFCASSESEDFSIITFNQHLSFDGVKKSLSGLKEQLEKLCQEVLIKIPSHVAAGGKIVPSGETREDLPKTRDVPQITEDCPKLVAGQIISHSEPKTREDFLKHFCHLTLDPNTAHRHLTLSEHERVVTQSGTVHSYSDHPERFDCWTQVLCKESVRGQCYFEVEWKSREWFVFISVTYKGISRKGLGHECGFGNNKQSWSLLCSSTLSFWHNNNKILISEPPSSKLGVYVDHSAGTLSFYKVSDALQMTLLYKAQTTFTQPLYVGFRVCSGTTVKLCDPQ